MSDPLVERLVAFIECAGIRVRTAPLGDGCFMPGVTVRAGELVYDPGRLKHPGDLLHEAGHIAVTAPELRPTLDMVSNDPGEEMATIAWSYAAARALEIDPAIVFHDDGYRNTGPATIIENFDAGRYFGVPLLEWYGMAANAGATVERFPHMLR